MFNCAKAQNLHAINLPILKINDCMVYYTNKNVTFVG